jgi:hypothetical protein
MGSVFRKITNLLVYKVNDKVNYIPGLVGLVYFFFYSRGYLVFYIAILPFHLMGYGKCMPITGLFFC